PARQQQHLLPGQRADLDGLGAGCVRDGHALVHPERHRAAPRPSDLPSSTLPAGDRAGRGRLRAAGRRVARHRRCPDDRRGLERSAEQVPDDVPQRLRHPRTEPARRADRGRLGAGAVQRLRQSRGLHAAPRRSWPDVARRAGHRRHHRRRGRARGRDHLQPARPFAADPHAPADAGRRPGPSRTGGTPHRPRLRPPTDIDRLARPRPSPGRDEGEQSPVSTAPGHRPAPPGRESARTTGPLPAVRPVPTSTYRLQLHAGFTADDAVEVVPYLAQLGVGHLFCSPVLQAAPGSPHGYDVVDHSRISEEIGGEEALRRLADAAHAHGMGLIADVVPNHMAIPTPIWHNRALWSVLRDGPGSDHADLFDVDLDGERSVLVPVMGRPCGAVLADEEISVGEEQIPGPVGTVRTELVVRYYDHVLPVAAGTEHLGLADLLDRQWYRLAYWKVADDELD